MAVRPGVALEWLRSHGTDPLAWHWLESDFHVFRTADGAIGYVDTGGAWVSGGPPAAPEAVALAVARDFVRAARGAGRRAVFFGVPPALVRALGGAPLAVGLRPFWDPRAWTLEGPENAALRYQLARAKRNGVNVRSVTTRDLAADGALRSAVLALARHWLARHSMAPMGFLVALELFVEPDAHRYYVAERAGELVGFLSAVPALGRGGWFVEDLLRTSDAPNGTNELLLESCFRAARAEEAPYLTLGLSPLAGPIPWPLRVVRALALPWFDFRGLARFKDKLRPHGEEVRYVGAAGGVRRARALLDVLTAFAGGSLVRFAVRTLLRGSLALVGVLTLLLWLWTPVLAIASTAKWFPSPAVKIGWVSFDVALAVALLALCRRYRPKLALALALAVTADAVVTTLQVVHFNAPRAGSLLDRLVLVAACTGPVLGAAALWLVYARQRSRER